MIYYVCEKLAQLASVADASTFGYVRGILNTIPNTVEITGYRSDFLDKWIDSVNKNISTKGICDNVNNLIDKKNKLVKKVEQKVSHKLIEFVISKLN